MAHSQSPRLPPGRAFPFSDYRPHQEEILTEASDLLFRNTGIKNVIIDAPTGIGKSAINTALCRQARSAFLTTPQRKLRDQLAADDTLSRYYRALRARRDYSCPVRSPQEQDWDYDCDSCPVNQSSEESCIEYGDRCPYWRDKSASMERRTAALTFSYLIVDHHLPIYSPEDEDGNKTQISFANRELLVVDECHSLEDQVASLHAGFTLSPHTLPAPIYAPLDGEVEADTTTVGEIEELLRETRDRCSEYISNQTRRIRGAMEQQMGDVDEELQNAMVARRRLDFVFEEIENGRDWVVEIGSVMGENGAQQTLEITPVFVDNFLREFVWSRADKRVLSTATMPFRSSPETWCQRLGLDPSETHVIHKPMPFPSEQRPIHTKSIIDRFSKGGDRERWSEIIDTIDLIARKHSGQKGLIHTVSYERATDLYESFRSNAVLHERGGQETEEYYIREWQESDCDMLLSPSLMEGVDLPGDQCRWQVLVKVPYPIPSDPRVGYILDELSDWNWYYQAALQQLIQSVGRGVRSEHDSCDYYVLDQCFLDVIDETSPPEWFTDAIN